MNTVELNKLKKGELVELATQLQRERSNFSNLIATLRNNEAGLQELAANLQTEKAELKERFALLNSERDLLERKYREWVFSDTNPTTYLQTTTRRKSETTPP